MKRKVLITVVLLLTAILTSSGLTGCTRDGGITLNVYNWGDYIDESVIEEFEERYNIKVSYDTFATNEDMYVKIKAGGADYDVAIPSDYMIRRMIVEDMLYQLDMKNIPNYAYIEDRFKNLSYDPENKYSVPYMWGTVGILYNKTMVDEEVNSWKILWDEKYDKQILMQDSPRDCIGIALKMLGYSMNTRNMEELETAKEALIRQKPFVLAYVVDEVKDKMIAGEAALATVWSGDAFYCMGENPDLSYTIPKEGSNKWFDAMVVPKTCKNRKEAELFINFMCETEIAFKNTDYIQYATPHSEVMKRLPQELVNDRSAYPTEEDLENCEIFEYLEDFIKEYDRIWTEIKAE